MKCKILFLIDNLGSGGAQRQMTTLALLFTKQGYNVEFLVYDDADFFKPVLLCQNIVIHQVATKSSLDRILEVRKFIRNNNQDVVISFLDTPNFLASISAIGGKKWKLIISERSNNPKRFKSIKHKIYSFFYKFADVIICNSENSEQFWAEKYPQYKKKLNVIYNTVLLDELENNDYVPKKDNKLHVVVVASYQYLKNPIGLIKALCMLNEQERMKIMINWYGSNKVSGYGTKAYDESLLLIDKNNLKEVIQLNDNISNVSDVMNSADVVGLFSQYEGLPNTICEALMTGKPIVMTKVSDYSILVDENNGFLCEWDKLETIKEALVKALNLSEKQLAEMGENSKKKAERLFSNNKIILQWLGLIDK